MPSPAQAAPVRSGIARLAPPKPLAFLLGIVLITGIAWSVTVPPWQSPDESAHFAYVQSLAERFRLPGEKGRPATSSDQSAADAAVGASRGAFAPQASPPNWSRADAEAYRALEQGRHPPSRTDGSGPNPASTNPPLYYLYASLGYRLDESGTAFGRLYAIRLAGVLLLLATVVAAWLLAGEALGRGRLGQLACAAVAGLLPMVSFISTSANPDALMISLWTFALWLGARVIRRGALTADAAALCVVTAAAILTKATSYALVPPVALALAFGWLAAQPAERRATLRRLGLAGLALVLPVLGWLVLAHALGRSGINTITARRGAAAFSPAEFVNYLWQFYLPRAPFLSPFREVAPLPLWHVWIRETTGVFGWLDVPLPTWLYAVSAVVASAVAVTAVALLTRLRDRRNLQLLGFFALALVALLVLLHITEYRSIIAHQGPILQGRYALPIVGLVGLAVGLIVVRVPPRARVLTCGGALTALLALQAISLTTVLHAYYL